MAALYSTTLRINEMKNSKLNNFSVQWLNGKMKRTLIGLPHSKPSYASALNMRRLARKIKKKARKQPG
jgi:hypothetical protein